nr:hypothetical protein [Tanacetum cinerariifolium]
MTTLTFADVHNMVVFLAKPTKKTHIHAKVDGKKVIISEASIRRDLRFVDKGGVDCFSNEVIFKQLTFMGKPRRRDTEETQPSDLTTNVEDEAFNEENVSKHSNDPLHSDEDRIKLTELIELYTNLQQRVGLSARVESFAAEAHLDEEDAFKQEMISDIDANKDIYLVSVHKDEDIFGVNDQNDTSMFDADKDLQSKEVVVEKVVADKKVSAVEKVNVASITTPVSCAATTPTAATTPIISIDEITLAKALIEIKTSRPKAKGIVMQEPSETPTSTPIVSSQQPSKVQDKGKGIMVKEPVKLKKKDQILFDEEVARKLQEEIYEQERLAKVNADYQLAEILQAEEQEQLTDAEKEKLFMELLEKRRKFFAAKRTKEKRNRPPTKLSKEVL